MLAVSQPVVNELSLDDSRAILARNHVGRLAFAVDGDVEIRPLQYVLSKQVIYGRIVSARLAFDRHPQCVAFEVDEIQSMHSWKSVIARGELSLLHPTDRESPEGEDQRRTEDYPQSVARQVFDTNSMLDRSVVFRLQIDELTGIACS